MFNTAASGSWQSVSPCQDMLHTDRGNVVVGVRGRKHGDGVAEEKGKNREKRPRHWKRGAGRLAHWVQWQLPSPGALAANHIPQKRPIRKERTFSRPPHACLLG